MNRGDLVEHVGWTGVGIAWTLTSSGLMATGAEARGSDGISFVQISDSHIGFARPENPDVAATLRKTIEAINALPHQAAFVVHTGDLTHLSKPAQFDTTKQLLSALNAPLITVPGEHDVIGSPANYFASFKRKDAPQGWYAFDQGGVHFVSLVNVFNFEIDGKLGAELLEFLAKDLAA